MTKVLIADDHGIVRNALKELLSGERSIKTIGEASSGTETIRQLQATNWDLLILDINMPDRSGLDILSRIRTTHAQTKVLVLSGYAEKQYAVSMLRAGASGYLNKDMAPEELLTAVRTVLQGRRYVSTALAQLLVDGMDDDADKPLHSKLSQREFQIFCKLATGNAVSNIADELCISVKTISTYRSRVMEKMNFASNADITTYAIRNQII